ncbi:hypothetical protein HOT49_gp168 [Erwinia phage vB_EamM_Alexandra]|uniref:Uncharacterized protein n=1 Tax=Erwinia phage vB_EamM_Alexandra TaxID=2201424 RepID=A0A2Z4QDU2_9CAUD|nr:hypothetical protein HOT49_gp168 [Erwinia phage vB_EamM_Alexandra]AWY08440.1 hypothetical protein Alexandra_170 [Erwinia phage vB_EamM_Alexandra]
MFSDPIFKLITDTLRAHDNIIFDGQYDVEGGETFRVQFVAKSPAPDNKADIDLSAVFAQFPDGFAVQRVADIDHTKVRSPVGGPGNRAVDEHRGTFLLTVTKANWQAGEEGVVGSDPEANPVEDDSLEDIIQRYRKLPEAKQKIFIKFARTFLKGVAL